MSIEIDPRDLIYPDRYGIAGQPHDAWTRLRHESPVHYCETEDYPPFWAITRHADIIGISSRPEIFSNSEGPMLLNKVQLADREESNPFSQMRTIIEMDPPEHVEFRKVASGLFTPRRIHRLDEIVRDCARQEIDKLGEEGEVDFVEAIAQRHPLRVLSTLLGIDRKDEERVLELTQQLFGGEDPDLQRPGEDRLEATKQLGLEFMGLFSKVIEDRRANPRDDLASRLANAKLADGRPMGPLETFGYYFIVFTAGHDTTRNAISGGVKALLDHPGQLQKLLGHPELSKTTVEEIVRWTSPVNYMQRVLLQDSEVGGQKLSQGERIILYYGSANRDEHVFDRPFDFDITRRPNRHLGFGTGEHFCLGAHVARLSSRALFEELANRVVELEPAGSPREIASSFVVGLKSLPVRYKIRPSA